MSTQTTEEINVSQMLKEAEQARLYGTIQLDFQDGKLVLVRRTETFKLGKGDNSRHGDNNK